MGKRAASNSFEQQSSLKQGVLASESCEQQIPSRKSPQMKRLMTSSGMYQTLSTPPDPQTSLPSTSSETLRYRSQSDHVEKTSADAKFLASSSLSPQLNLNKIKNDMLITTTADAPAMTNLNAATRRMAKMRKPRNIIEAGMECTAYRQLSEAELQAGVMTFLVKEQELEDLASPQQDSTSFTFPIALPLAPSPSSVAQSPIDISDPQQTRDIDVDMCAYTPLSTAQSPARETEKFPLMKDTDTDMDALMNGMESLDLIRVRKRRGAMSGAPQMPFFTRQRR